MTLSTLNKLTKSPNLLIDFNSVKKRLESTLQTLFQRLNNQTWSGTQYSTAYDTAWGASFQKHHKKPYFPQAIQWLLNNQHYDGSWGSDVRETIAERMLSTATVLGTLLQYDFSNDIIDKGFNWLHNNFKNINSLGTKFTRTAGFELLFPSMLKRLSQKDLENRLNINFEPILRLQEEKLSRLPLQQILLSKTPVVHSLEFLEGIDRQIPSLDIHIGRNNSLGCAPSTTAWYANQNPRTKPGLIHYLKRTQHFDGGWPAFTDYELMNIPFVIYPLSQALGYIPEQFTPILQRLYNKWTPLGIGFSEYFEVSDADNTALGLLCLYKQHLIHSDKRFWQSIELYENNEYFNTYPFEIEPSLMVNLHVLDLFQNVTNHPRSQTIIDKLYAYFDSKMKNGTLPGDKYHFSPSFQNCHGILTFANRAHDLAEKCFQYFERTQNSNGLWGIENTQVEETSFAVLALSNYHKLIEPIDLNNLLLAVEYLIMNWNSRYAEQWTSKIFHSPTEMIQAHIFAALASYAKVRGMNVSF